MGNKILDGAKAIFEKSPGIDELHYTDDGQAFPKKNNALVHQREMGKKEEDIVTVKREDVLSAPIAEEAAEILVKTDVAEEAVTADAAEEVADNEEELIEKGKKKKKNS